MLQRLRLLVLAVAVLFSGLGCAQSSTLLKPGDKIGDMTLVKAPPNSQRYSAFCLGSTAPPERFTPGKDQTSCEAPRAQFLWFDNGWGAIDKQTLEDNWRALTFELYIDEQQVDLAAFGTIDEEQYNSTAHTFGLALENATGKHTIRFIRHHKVDVDDGFNTYKAGSYETITTISLIDQ